MVETHNLEYNYSGSKVFSFPDIKLDGGDTMLILGKSGIGKTTLLHLLGGLMKPIKGEILVNNTDIAKLTQREGDRFRGKNISIIFQQNHFIASLHVLDNLLLAQKLSSHKEDKSLCLSYLDRLGIGDKAYKYTNQLSQGERQRVSIVRALVTKPSLILADEPTSALDDMHAAEVAQLLVQNAKEVNAALIIVTHDQRLKSYISNSLTLA